VGLDIAEPDGSESGGQLRARSRCPKDVPAAMGASGFSRKDVWMTTSPVHLKVLEAESIYILREAAAQAARPVLLYSIGKDSSVLLHLARKAFFPARPPWPLLHIDTTWKFRDMIRHRDETAKRYGFDLIIYTNQEGLRQNVNPFDHGSSLYTQIMKTDALKQALSEGQYDIAIAGARRDEERSRAKERVFSVRGPGHVWDPKRQRPELWQLYNGSLAPGETLRVFPLANWTERDVWTYIATESVEVVPLYFAAERPTVVRDGALIVVDDARMRLEPGERLVTRRVRFRSLGCYPLSAAVESEACSLGGILQEMRQTRLSERAGRLIDLDQDGSMERKKREGYF
jgi:sulfate adenylyltransferase subunit 2